MGETEKEAAALGQKLSILEHIPRVGISIRAKVCLISLWNCRLNVCTQPLGLTAVSSVNRVVAASNFRPVEGSSGTSPGERCKR